MFVTVVSAPPQGIWSGDYDDGVTALKGFHELPGTVAKYYDLSYSAAKERFSSGGISVPIAGKQKSAFVPASAVEGFLLPNGGVDTIIDALKVINPAAGGHRWAGMKGCTQCVGLCHHLPWTPPLCTAPCT